MRTFNTILLLAACLALVQAEEENAQQQKPLAATSESTPVPQSNPFAVTEPLQLTPQDVEQAMQGMRDIFSQIPVQHMEPLFQTMDGYCSAFKGLCQAACKEREAEKGGKVSKDKITGCVDPLATTVAAAAATCKCVDLDMTDRINFAIVGGIVSSEKSSKEGFAADGILDNLTSLPAVPTFINIIHVIQNVCFYAGYLDILATNAHPGQCAKTDGLSPGGIIGSVGGTVGSVLGKVGGLFGGILGGGGSSPAPAPTTGPAPAPTAGSGNVVGDLLGKVGGLFGGILGGGGGGSPPAPPSTPAPTKALAPTPGTKTTPIADPAPTPTPAPAPGLIGGLLGKVGSLFGGGQKEVPKPTSSDSATPTPTPSPRRKLFGLFAETEENGDVIEDQEDKTDAEKLVGNDGRVARIVRVQKRRAEKIVKKKGRNDL